MLTQQDLGRFRDVADSAMLDTCEVRRPDVVGKSPDPVTLEYSREPGDLVYAGACEVDRESAQPRPSDAGSGDQAQREVQIKLPIRDPGAQGARRDDIVRITASAQTPSLVGRALTVQAIAEGTLATRRRLTCTEGV